MRTALKADPRVGFRRSGSDWIGLHFGNRKDLEFVSSQRRISDWGQSLQRPRPTLNT